MTELTAKPHCCEEADWQWSKTIYVPCNAPATKRVKEPNDGPERRMCAFHASHSVDNRRFSDLGDYVRPEEAPSEPTYDYSEYAKHEGPDTSSELGQLSALAEQARQAEYEVERAQRELKRLQGIHQGLVEQQIPEVMERVGIQKFATTSGLNIELKEIIRASLGSGPEKERNIDWLEDNGHETIVKMSVVVPFGRGEEERSQAKALAERLKGEQLPAQFDRKVEPSTLGALIRELLEEGRPVPEDSFHVFRQRVAKIKE